VSESADRFAAKIPRHAQSERLRETRQSIDLACISQKVDGPVAYRACLNQQIASLQRSAGHDAETQQTAAPSTSSGGRKNSDKSKRRGTAVRSVNAMSGYTADNIMKVHRGMKSDKILEMFGAPKDVSQSICGGAVGTPWACTTWVYRDSLYDGASFTFSGESGSLVLNDFNIHRK
jgi:hypothetical protein